MCIILTDKRLYIFDMDGTIYIEDQLIDGADLVLRRLKSEGKSYVFLSNNSSININDYVLKLNMLGISCSKEQIYSSGLATALYLFQERKGKTVFLLGTKALLSEFISIGIKVVDRDPDIVVVGFDRELEYSKIEKACEFLDGGAEFIATNPDILFPLKNGRYIPDCGCICNMLIAATGKTPFFIGKPQRYIIDIILKDTGFLIEETVIVGDRLYTDIAAGINAGISTILVLSGETKRELLGKSVYKPNLVIPTIKSLL